ncbi:MAG TPA: UDP-N-acetylglucosamine 2-epimerase (non-hydrolyzing) [Puia sp.]|jgi:UDP-N-acetylglucosamine 2-epimerase (non-hydrolysing)|nr:UDP-N-acetylglucosamine 2-epimerase (non-hydrolyzing) [Puia sp.]
MKLLFIFGTRPEAIKMAPIINACRQHPDRLDVRICLTGQHREMLDQVMQFFEIVGDYDLELMQPNQTLYDITARCLTLLQAVLRDWEPDLVLVQGDTTSAFAGALAAFYSKVSIAHVEAGLRSHNKYSPFPEEINRKLISAMADLHLTPTALATENLRQERVSGTIRQVGNTVIDALLYGVEKVRRVQRHPAGIPDIPLGHRLILVTGHRRESFGRPFEEICNALLELAKAYPDVAIIYPVHLNPNIKDVVYARLGGVPTIHLIPPVDYATMIWLLDHCYLVITDSGGIQEEAPALGKPVLVIRDVTERTEGIEAGTAVLVGTSRERILLHARRLLDDPAEYDRMARAVNPYGDGKSANKIVDILLNDRVWQRR